MKKLVTISLIFVLCAFTHGQFSTGPEGPDCDVGGTPLVQSTVTFNGSPAASGNAYIDGLIQFVFTTTNKNLLYSFPTSSSDYNGFESCFGTEAAGLVPFNADQQAATIAALTRLSSITQWTFTLASVASTANLKFGNSTNASGGYTCQPGSGHFTSSVTWLHAGQFTSPVPGNRAWWTIFHESEHGFFAKHPFQNVIPYGVVPVDNDAQPFTIMAYASYIGGTLTGPDTNETNGYPTTHTQDDIATMQYLFGVSTTSCPGNTTYSWNQSTGVFSINGGPKTGYTPAANRVFMTIYDSGGTNTFSLGNYTSNITANLNTSSQTVGGFVILDTAQLADLNAGNPGVNIAPFNVSIARNTVIHNITTGSGNDDITGNSANNTVDGGTGTNTFRFSDVRANYTVTGPTNGYCQFVSAADGTDLLKNIQTVVFSDGPKSLNGSTCALT